SVISHGITGLALANAFALKKLPLRFWLLSIILPILPDADVIGFSFGIEYQHLLGHRGLSHSLFFAVILAVITVTCFFPQKRIFSIQWWGLTIYFSMITASHGILDAMTTGGLGIAFFAPFDNTRYFLPWRLIQVAPIDIYSFLSEWGKRVLLSEFKWVWLPSGILLLIGSVIRKLRYTKV
ncbi:MAG: metal-dependent hydrolase, partial [Calditrichae bacterium]|nr:metal-dependent hydrolase [Calditrichia bacterium]